MSDDFSQRKLTRELEIIRKDPSENYSAGPTADDLLHWTATIFGPSESPFEGGVFKLNLDFSTGYPFVPPKVRFLTKIYHPNISSRGAICLDILGSAWTSSISIDKLLLSITSLLCDPNADEPYVVEIGRIYKEDRDLYNEIAREWTKEHAMG